MKSVSIFQITIRILKLIEIQVYYPKVEYPGPDFLKDTCIIRNLIYTIQQVTIMQVLLTCLIITDIIF